MMAKTRWRMILAAGVLAIFAGGCRTTPAGGGATTKPWSGPTLPLNELVGRINGNNQRIQTLWTRHITEANIVDENGEAHFVNLEGVLMMRKPDGFFFQGDKDVLKQNVVVIGTAADRYWLTIDDGKRAEHWWGFQKNAGKPCVRSDLMPINPNLIAEVLGIADINTNLLAAPVPVMRFNPDERAYMVVWQAPAGNYCAAQKEVWYDVETLLPKAVFLFDRNGRVVLRAWLSRYVRVGDEPEGGAADERPVVASYLSLYFPETHSTMHLQLSSPRLQYKNRPGADTIRYRGPNDGMRTTQIDADCE